jgi:hypothetical protein
VRLCDSWVWFFGVCVVMVYGVVFGTHVCIGLFNTSTPRVLVYRTHEVGGIPGNWMAAAERPRRIRVDKLGPVVHVLQL